MDKKAYTPLDVWTMCNNWYRYLFFPQRWLYSETTMQLLDTVRRLYVSSPSVPQPLPKMTTTRQKRNVSGYIKKWVASKQQWRCGTCHELLEASYEIDHRVSLENGGNNDVSNLVALCRKCHGLKTFHERMEISP